MPRIELDPTEAMDGPEAQEDFADDFGARHGTPPTAVARIGVVVAHHEVPTRWHRDVPYREAQGLPVGPILSQWFAIHIDRVAFGREMIARQANHALDQICDGIMTVLGHVGRRFEYDDVTDVDGAIFNAQFVHDDSIADVQCWFHRLRGYVEGLERESSDEERDQQH